MACVLPHEVGVRRRWRAFIRSAIGKAIRDPVVVDIVTDCWTHRTDGTIHTACDDQEQGWLPPTMRQLADVGSWEFDPSGVPPVFSSRVLREQETESSDSESDGGCDRRMVNSVVTANGRFGYGLERH